MAKAAWRKTKYRIMAHKSGGMAAAASGAGSGGRRGGAA